MSESFKLTKEHIKLIQNMYVDWWDCEFGAPCINPKRPYGNSDVIKDMAKILGKKLVETSDGDEVVSKTDGIYLERLHEEMQTALQIVLCTKSFKPGFFIKKDEYADRSWKRIKNKG